ncbi:MAG TPA: GMC family oxidoreductase, partial [Solirubrobacterales bacterium]|nr:GMC family oxidoreductase [Solirubrobacterales bacterium]
VTAYRLAEAGQRVLVLERGKPYPPGSFPRSPLDLSKNFWDPSEGLHGMFDLWSFEGLESLISSGLGGGSLIYANVMIRKDPAWFVKEDRGPGYEYWPVTYEDLEPHYERAERMLGATPYPFDQAPYDSTPKTRAFKATAEELGRDWFLPDLAVSFAPEPGAPAVPGEPIPEERPNIHGRTRQTCRLVGECDVGCNFGSKNSLDYTYLTAAWHAGAEIRCRHEVRGFEPREGGGYAIHYVEHSPEQEGTKTDTKRLPRSTVTADRLVLSAGTLGSTFLLLRNRAAFPGLSRALGTHFSGNGDLLSFAVRCSEAVAGGKPKPRVINPGYGPVITSAIRMPDEHDDDGVEGERGFYLEDAGFPEFGTWLLQGVETPGTVARMAPRILARIARRVLRRDYDTSLSGEISSLFGDCELSSGVLPLLGMGRDIPDGRMFLEKERLQVDWNTKTSEAYFKRVRNLSDEICDRLGGSFMDNPIWHLNRVITVHPLGGCPMGWSAEEGVVDANCEVFGYPGLHVVDGSVMPGPVGPNPSLTIAAVADRAAEAILGGATADLPRQTASPPPSPPPPPPAEPTAPVEAHRGVSIAFTEEMKGFVGFGEEDFERGSRDGEGSGTRFMFHLTITADDLDRFITDPDHLGRAEGYVECDALGGRREVEAGLFNLFVNQDGGRRRKRMLYRLHFTDGEEHPVTMTGFKVVEDDPGVDNVWKDTSTLYTRVLAGHVGPEEDEAAETIAAGILHIEPLDFARQLTTFDTTPNGRLDAVARFGALFAGNLWEVYGPAAKGNR